MSGRLLGTGGLAVALVVCLVTACQPSSRKTVASAQPPAEDSSRYRLGESGEGWTTSGADPVLDDLWPRYSDFYGRLFDTEYRGDYDLRPLRRDLEHVPPDQRNFDALNTVAIAYFELNHRAQQLRGGTGYFDSSYRAAKLLSLPWKAYGLVETPALREAILDFFADAASGEKLDSRSTAPRLARIVASLESKENDDERLERIRALVEQLERHTAPLRPLD